MKRLLLLAATLLFSSDARAAHNTALFMGMGTATCAQFANDYKANVEADDIYFVWARGFMSGRNSVLHEGGLPTLQLDSMPDESQKFFLRTYCDAHPLLPYVFAVMELQKSLKTIEAAPHAR